MIFNLLNALKPEYDKDLCDKLSALYTYMYRLLTDANIQHELEPIDEAIKLLEYDKETWKLLMEKAAEERIAGAFEEPAESASGNPQAAASAPSPDAYTPLSIEG